jgi:Sec-independent protein translocase protein TatA
MTMGELLLTFVVALFVLGPKQLPTLARQLGIVLQKVNQYRAEFYQLLASQHQLQENQQKAVEADKQYQQTDSKN